MIKMLQMLLAMSQKKNIYKTARSNLINKTFLHSIFKNRNDDSVAKPMSIAEIHLVTVSIRSLFFIEIISKIV